MAIHTQRVGLIREALAEMIHVAGYSVTQKKTDRTLWGRYATGGILGFPSAVLLFSIIDCIGSVCRGNEKFTIKIDGKERTINNTSQHIYILNSKYFGMNLRQLELDNIYKNIRSPLTHNSLLPSGYILYDKDDHHNDSIRIAPDKSGNLLYCIYLIPLYEQTVKAVNAFMSDLDNGQIDFESSAINLELKKRDTNLKLDYLKEYDLLTITPPERDRK